MKAFSLRFADYFFLFKPQIVALLVLVAGVSAATAYGGAPPADTLLLLVAAGGLASAGSTALNQYLDQDIDKVMERTRYRILPSGRFGHPHWVLLLGLFLIALSLPFSLGLSPGVAFYTLAGAFIYVVVYTLWLKRRSSWNIVIGGVAGSCAVLAGWSAVTPAISLVPLILATILFLWTPAHFWSFAMVYQEEYRQAGIPMLPLVVGESRVAQYILLHIGLVFILSLILGLVGDWGGVYFGAAILSGLFFLGLGTKLVTKPSPQIAWVIYKISGVYLGVLFLGMLLDMWL